MELDELSTGLVGLGVGALTGVYPAGLKKESESAPTKGESSLLKLTAEVTKDRQKEGQS